MRSWRRRANWSLRLPAGRPSRREDQVVRRRLLSLAFVTLSVCTVAGCHDQPASTPAATPATTSDRRRATTGDEPLVIHTTITYTRPRLFALPGGPVSFGFVKDYREAGAEDVTTVPGAWNDAAQTFTADVTITLKSENLVFVDDPAISPESETPMRSGRSGNLPEVACPSFVPPQHPCYVLQVLR
jgi:hypothetical protein